MFKMHHVEVYKQSDRFTTKLQVRKYLSKMYWGDAVNLDLDNDKIFHNQIHSIAEFELHSSIYDRQPNLSSRPEARASQLVFEASGVVLSNNPGPSSVCTFIAAVMMAWLTC
jgi:hypothetical protein